MQKLAAMRAAILELFRILEGGAIGWGDAPPPSKILKNSGAQRRSEIGPGPTTFQNVPTSMCTVVSSFYSLNSFRIASIRGLKQCRNFLYTLQV